MYTLLLLDLCQRHDLNAEQFASVKKNLCGGDSSRNLESLRF